MFRALIKHFALLLDFSRPQDWQPGTQPIVWLSVKETAWRLGVSTSQVRRNEKTLHGLGALAWKDSPNHRRFGSRAATGQIVEAYGVNLAPAVALLPELRRLARDEHDDRTHWKFLRNRITDPGSASLPPKRNHLSSRDTGNRESGQSAFRLPLIVKLACGRLCRGVFVSPAGGSQCR